MGGSSAPPGDLRRKFQRKTQTEQRVLRRAYLSSIRIYLARSSGDAHTCTLHPRISLDQIKQASTWMMRLLDEIEDTDDILYREWAPSLRPLALSLWLSPGQQEASATIATLTRQVRVLSHMERLRERRDPLMSPACPACHLPQVALEDVVTMPDRSQRMIYQCLRCRHVWEAVVARKPED